MHASEVVATLPTARLDDPVLRAAQLVTRESAPGLAVTDENGEVVACMSSLDLLWLTMPRYLRDAPRLAGVIDEEHADRIAEALRGTRVRDVVRELTDRIPSAGPDATIVELADLMMKKSSSLVQVQERGGHILGTVTAHGLLEALLAVEDRTS